VSYEKDDKLAVFKVENCFLRDSATLSLPKQSLPMQIALLKKL